MTGDQLVLMRRDGPLVALTINRERAGNRLNRATMRALIDAIGSAGAEPEVRLVAITGAGSVFCLGGEPDGLDDRDVVAQLDYSRAFLDLAACIRTLRLPIIAAVNGDAVAGGASLVQMCDLAVAADTARFGFPEIERGLFPMLAMAVARDLLPPKLALQLFYTGDRISARRAQELHFVNEVVPPSELWTAVDRWTATLVARRAISITLGRAAFHAMAGMHPDDRPRYAQAMMTTMFGMYDPDWAAPADVSSKR